MKNWWIGLGMFVVLAGCGGGTAGGTSGGSGGGSGGGGGTTNLVPAPIVTLSNNANMQFTAITGQGRRSLESHIVSIPGLKVRNDFFDIAALNGTINATLESYTLSSLSTTYSIPATLYFKHFNTFPIAITAYTTIDSGGTSTTWTGTLEPSPFSADVMLSRGRDTVLQFSMNDAIVYRTDAFSDPIFDVDQFVLENSDSISGDVESLFSDYVAFDISSMSAANRPNLKSGAEAEKALFSGDAISISAGYGSFGSLQILDPILDPAVTQDQGVINAPIVIGGVATEGVYTVFEPDPREIDPLDGIIVSLQGRWRPYTQVLSGMGNYSMIFFPSSRSHDTGNTDFLGNSIFESNEFTAVYIARNSLGNITALWQGPARLSGPNANEIRLSRIKDIVGGLEVDPAVGVLSSPVNGLGGLPTTGTFTFPSGSVPADFSATFPLTGSYRIFRK